MTLPKPLQSPERDVLLVSALIAIVVVPPFTGWGVLAYVVTGLVLPRCCWPPPSPTVGRPTAEARVGLLHARHVQ